MGTAQALMALALCGELDSLVSTTRQNTPKLNVDTNYRFTEDS